MASQRPARVADSIREEISVLIAREVHDPGIGFLTITRVEVTPDLQQARLYYTVLGPGLGDATARRDTERALDRATPFLRRRLGGRLRLRRTPELQFFFDESVGRQDRVEQIIRDIQADRAANPIQDDPPDAPLTTGDHGRDDDR